MPLVKVPGIGREFWFELHETESPAAGRVSVGDFVRTTLSIQKSDGAFMSMDQAKAEAARMLGVDPPSDAEFKHGLTLPGPVRGRGRKPLEALSRRDAVAAVAVYFETVGAGAEQAITLAKQWLGVSVSRKVAKAAVFAFRSNTSPEQIEPQARWACAIYRPLTTQPLPAAVTRKRKKRATKSDLG